jgi:ArsR family metal-binding transcriptional regulator
VKKKNPKAKNGTQENTNKDRATSAAENSKQNNLAWAIPGITQSRPIPANIEQAKEVKKLGVNKYKVAHAAQDQRMDKVEATLAAMSQATTTMKVDPRIGRLEEAMAALIANANKGNKEDPRISKLENSIEAIAQSQHNTVKAIKQVIEGQGETKAFVRALTEKVRYNKKQADEDHKLMTEAMKLFHDNLVQSQTMINALQRVSESPIRKKRATMQPGTNSDKDSDEESSFNSTKMGPLSAVSHPDTSFQRDANMDNMEGAADEN